MNNELHDYNNDHELNELNELNKLNFRMYNNDHRLRRWHRLFYWDFVAKRRIILIPYAAII